MASPTRRSPLVRESAGFAVIRGALTGIALCALAVAGVAQGASETIVDSQVIDLPVADAGAPAPDVALVPFAHPIPGGSSAAG
mgnify:CR=1 FL=1